MPEDSSSLSNPVAKVGTVVARSHCVRKSLGLALDPFYEDTLKPQGPSHHCCLIYALLRVGFLTLSCE